MDARETILEIYAMGYRVDAQGNVRTPRGTIRKVDPQQGYLRFTRRLEGQWRHVFVHKLVAFQKYGEAIFKPGVVVRHKDDNKANNRPSNILIGTQHDNIMDRDPEARRAHARRAASANRRLSDAERDALVRDRKRGMTYKQLREKYGLSKAGISYLLHGKTYAPVTQG